MEDCAFLLRSLQKNCFIIRKIALFLSDFDL